MVCLSLSLVRLYLLSFFIYHSLLFAFLSLFSLPRLSVISFLLILSLSLFPSIFLPFLNALSLSLFLSFLFNPVLGCVCKTFYRIIFYSSLPSSSIPLFLVHFPPYSLERGKSLWFCLLPLLFPCGIAEPIYQRSIRPISLATILYFVFSLSPLKYKKGSGCVCFSC